MTFPDASSVVGVNFTTRDVGDYPNRPFSTNALVHVTAVAAVMLPESTVVALEAPANVALALTLRSLVIARTFRSAKVATPFTAVTGDVTEIVPEPESFARDT